MDWDDFRYFLALYRGGTIMAAASSMNVSRSTLNRRVAKLEELAGVNLFEQEEHGFALSNAGERLLKTALRMEEESLSAYRMLSGESPEPVGRLDVAVFDVGSLLFGPAFSALRQEHPQIELRVHASDSLRSLHRREADIALRAAVSPPSPDLFGRRVGRVGYAVYGRRRVVAKANPPWVLWVQSAPGTEELAHELGQPLSVAARVDTVHAMLEMTRLGLGVALLPVLLAERYKELVPMGPVPRAGQSMDVWTLTHPGLKRAAKVRAAMKTLARHVAATLKP